MQTGSGRGQDGPQGSKLAFVSSRPFCLGVIIVMGTLLLVNLVLLIVALTSGHVGYRTAKVNNLSLTVTNKGRATKGELIFTEDFNTFDLDTWEHEITMGGGGNGEFQLYDNNRSVSFVKYGKLHIKPTLSADRFGEPQLTNGHRVQLGGGAPADKCTNELFNGCIKVGSVDHPINPVMSARIRTQRSFSFKYGRVEVKAKIPTGDWLWPAIWLMPAQNQYGGWPASGEIDIMESRGNTELYQHCNEVGNGCYNGKRNIGTERVGSTLHYGPFFPQNGWDKAHFSNNSLSGEGFNHKFHRYQVEWTPEHLKFSIDDKEIGTSKPPEGYWKLGGFPNTLENPWKYAENANLAPFDQRFYLIINLAVGGNNGYFPDDTTGPVRKPWKNNSQRPMADFWEGRDDWLENWARAGEHLNFQVDYVRVWAL